MSKMRSILRSTRLRAAAFHLSASVLLGVAAALLVFALWYPYPYRVTSGGEQLLLILVSVDVVLGPLITLTIFNTRKPRTELVRDMAVVVLVQLAALGYGLWTVFEARPVYLVFEYTQFRVTHAVDVSPKTLTNAPAGLRQLPLTGPEMLALRPFRTENERTAATLAALQGLSLSARTDLWQPYAQAHERISQAAQPMSALFDKHVARRDVIDAAIRKTGAPASALVWLPLIDRETAWTVLLDAKTLAVRGYIPLDPF